MRTHLNEILKLGLSILIPQAAGLLGAFFTRSSISMLMGISAFLVRRKGMGYAGVKGALAIYGVQLSINVLWSWAFFYLRSPLAGLIVIPILWASGGSTGDMQPDLGLEDA